jgi:hypothetical protein
MMDFHYYILVKIIIMGIGTKERVSLCLGTAHEL